MANNTIEARLKIALQVAEAISGLKLFRGELKATKQEAATALGGGAGSAAKTDTDAAVSQVKRRTQAERTAAAERKRLDKEEADRKKQLAREAKKQADDEAAARRRAAGEEDRQRRNDDAARKKQERTAAYNAARLAPQLTDIGVGLATGQNPITVALQQGGQLRDIYGSAGGALRALLGVLTPMRVIVGGVAAGFGLLAVQMAAGYRESSQLNKSLALSGNIAGTSLGQINSLAGEISEQTGAGIGAVRDVLAEVLKINGQTSTTLGSTSRAVVALTKLTGQSAEEAVKGFESQADGITDWSVKANKAYNFLTASQVAYIRSLERQGRIAEATKFANEQLADTLQQRSATAIGSIERGWNLAGRAVAFFLDQLKSIGRDDTAEQRLEKLRAKLAELDGRAAIRAAGGLSGGRSAAVDEAERAKVQADIAATSRDMARRAENAAALREEQERIKREAKEFQSILAAQDQAAAQKSLAQKEAALDAERSLVERENAQELSSANDKELKLNAIEQRRAAAQQAFAERALQIERDRTVSLDSKNEVEAQQAQLTQLEAQVVTSKARLASAVSEGKRLIDAEVQRLDEEMRRRNAANTADDALRQSDPQRRAALEARAATDAARKEFDDLERDIRSRQATASKLGDSQAINTRLEGVLTEARKTLDEQTRKAKLASFTQQLQEQNQALALAEANIDQLVEQGAISTEEAEQRKFDARAAALPQLRELARLQKEIAATPAERTGVEETRQAIVKLADDTKETQKVLRSSIGSGLADLFVNVATGAKKGLDAVKDFVSGVARAMLNLIARRLGEQLVNSLFNAYNGTTSTPSSSSTVSAPVKHAGGLIGAAGGLARSVSPLVFAGAQVLHTGGIVGTDMGLKKNEVPVIAEVGEEMLTADNPRHIKNFKGGGVTVNSSVVINGATGAEQDQRAQAEQLQAMMVATVERWAETQRRQGGILAGVRNG